MDNDIKKTGRASGNVETFRPQTFVSDPAKAAAEKLAAPAAPISPTGSSAGSPPPAAASGDRSGRRDFLSFIAILAVAIGVAVLLISFVFRSYEVNGPSMQSTLQNDDKLIIWKVPRTWARITGHQWVPKRGDIVIFTESGLSAYGQQDTKQLIKRVIGLPGDRVVVSNDQVTIYNKQHPDGYQPDKTLGYNQDGHIATDPAAGHVTTSVTLGPNQLFVCGDHRDDSLDSRTFGPINTNQLIGQLVLRLLPANQIKLF